MNASRAKLYNSEAVQKDFEAWIFPHNGDHLRVKEVKAWKAKNIFKKHGNLGTSLSP